MSDLAVSEPVQFVLNGLVVEAAGVPATRTLLDFLRVERRLCGTKEGCAEGDCGACTVALGDVDDGVLRYRAVNACLLMLGQVDGKAVLTVEGLSTPDRELHPVQQAMAQTGASQCGFCTPGFVMALFALLQNTNNVSVDEGQGSPLSIDEVHDALAGNLCRCTGYRPIVDAALMAAGEAPRLREPAANVSPAALAALSRDGASQVEHDGDVFYMPRSLPALLDLRAKHPEAALLAGGTDLGLVVSKRVRPLDAVISLRDVAELHRIEHTPQALVVGAAVTYDRLLPELAVFDPSLQTLVRRFGSPAIRNLGTVGGNLGTGSPIGDMPPALLALGASVELASVSRTRTVALDDFFLGYRKTVVAPDEIIASIRIPRMAPGQQLRVYKVSKRYDQDISTVCGAFCVTLGGDRIQAVRLAFGGMAATPQRALRAEQALVGQLVSPQSFESAAQVIAQMFTPLSDMRSSAAYRSLVAANLLRRLSHDLAGSTDHIEVMSL